MTHKLAGLITLVISIGLLLIKPCPGSPALATRGSSDVLIKKVYKSICFEIYFRIDE